MLCDTLGTRSQYVSNCLSFNEPWQRVIILELHWLDALGPSRNPLAT
jgi:hypothetical protein